MRPCVRFTVLLAASAAPAFATQYTGQVVGTTGESDGARFGVIGAAQEVDRNPTLGLRFAISPLTPVEGEKIFRSSFE